MAFRGELFRARFEAKILGFQRFETPLTPKGGVFKGGGNWGTLRIPREDWGTLGNIRED